RTSGKVAYRKAQCLETLYLYRHLQSFYFSTLDIKTTHSTCGVFGNISIHFTFSNSYPYFLNSTKSRTRVFGLQDIYIISFAPKLDISLTASLCTPGLGGSTIINSVLSFKFLSVFATSPAINSQLVNPFNLAFSFAATTASSIISIP